MVAQCKFRNTPTTLHTSHHIPKVEATDVLAITFNPDKAVAAFPPPEEPVLLTKGLTQKKMRRGGMGNRTQAEVMSMPDTAAGDYMD